MGGGGEWTGGDDKSGSMLEVYRERICYIPSVKVLVDKSHVHCVAMVQGQHDFR